MARIDLFYVLCFLASAFSALFFKTYSNSTLTGSFLSLLFYDKFIYCSYYLIFKYFKFWLCLNTSIWYDSYSS